jgi:hypothetical protein
MCAVAQLAQLHGFFKEFLKNNWKKEWTNPVIASMIGANRYVTIGEAFYPLSTGSRSRCASEPVNIVPRTAALFFSGGDHGYGSPIA